MWLIERHSDGLGTARIRLPDPLRAALVRWYVGSGARQDEEAGITLVQQARIGGRWIACDCLGAEAPPPILTPAFLSEAETYYLRRLTSAKRPEHRTDCPFFRDQVTNRITQTRNAETPADRPSGYFEVLRPAPEKLAQRPCDGGSDDRTRSASVPRLARLLWRLLEGAGLNVIAPRSAERQERSIINEFQWLSGAAACLEIAPGIELHRALWTHGKALHSRRAYAGLRALARNWPRGHAPQGFVTLFAPTIKGTTIYPAGCEPIVVANRVQSPAVLGNPIKGPYLVIVVIGEYPEEDGYAPLRAYAQPIYAGNRFVPIEKENERSILRVLLAAQRMLEPAGVEIAIKKPVFDILTPVGPVRPDFLVDARSEKTGEIRRTIIQTAGNVSSDQPPSNISMTSRLEQIAPVLNIAADDARGERMLSLIMERLAF